eukprot:CAMPEP_0119105242 /NCGR_PEP_ID=MMETSP1180-20130426/3267_1 /TAXON_ID=3052 ORGANISM="Chlamydomonas cf sp, Strain CCMP681" /NCGR_SAMPLE_ID=MMETSP1180 /ASSEMBLY_ACC=CAM_ASM_000741 /LENGTH=44 /DNA_ID= /DNA_START= /DNA_END= /DNA_ORIENTATION=
MVQVSPSQAMLGGGTTAQLHGLVDHKMVSSCVDEQPWSDVTRQR